MVSHDRRIRDRFPRVVSIDDGFDAMTPLRLALMPRSL